MKNWKNTWKYYYLHMCTINANIWCMVPGILHATDIFFCHFGPFFAILPSDNPKIKILKHWKKHLEILSFTHLYHKWQTYDVWFLRYHMQQTYFFVILDHFLPFYPPINPKNQTFENMKNIPGDIIILHMCPINDHHMIYGSWDMEHDKQNFLLF